MLKPERLCAFSDGVVAIAITLLVLGIEVPSVHEVPEQNLSQFLIASLHPILGFVSSFVLIGTYWLQHYVVFRWIIRVDRYFVALNALFLLIVSFMPFPTGLQAAYRDDELAIVLYGATQIACSLSLLALWIYATRGSRLVAKELPPQVISSITRRIALTPLISLAAIAVSFVSIDAARIVFFAIPVLHLSHQAADSARTESNEGS